MIIFAAGLLFGAAMVFAILKSQEYQLLRLAKNDAEDLIQDAKSSAHENLETLKESVESDSDEKINTIVEEQADRWIEVEVQKTDLSARQSEIDSKINLLQNDFNAQLKIVKKHEKKIRDREEKLNKHRDANKLLVNQFVEQLGQQFNLDKAEISQQLSETLEREYVRNTDLRIKADMEWLKDEAEDEAKMLIMVALNRFSREYCAERGLSAIQFPSEKVAERFFSAEKSFQSEIEQLCGIDLIFDEDARSIAVAGFDPVRRELARRILIRMIKDGRAPDHPKAPSREDIYKKCRKELFNQIQKDGNRIAKELGLKDLHPEIRKMMGCLKYRYSFAQNQYFHCSEVGWFCGLLASELGLDVGEARRSGMLHDIGKSMDHSIEGGHAVIGADFIEKYNEKENIIHNVRAHHFDIQPENDAAFLVIGADALSGGRPGARRSTIDSYNQKILELETIGNSYKGVLSTYIVHGGREVRIIADGIKIDDVAAVKLSKDIALQIEETCNYPGQIKVVVVRESIATELTQGA